VELSISLSDVNRHRPDILLQNEAAWITKPQVLFHPKSSREREPVDN
jgi:hypothetical protein